MGVGWLSVGVGIQGRLRMLAEWEGCGCEWEWELTGGGWALLTSCCYHRVAEGECEREKVANKRKSKVIKAQKDKETKNVG